MSKKRILLLVAGIVMLIVGVVIMNMKKNYLFRQYGYNCLNISNEDVSSFELDEDTKVYFSFYCRAKDGSMSVSVKDSDGNVIFQSSERGFKESFVKELKAGTYYYDIQYSGIEGDFEIFAAVRTVFGINY